MQLFYYKPTCEYDNQPQLTKQPTQRIASPITPTRNHKLTPTPKSQTHHTQPRTNPTPKVRDAHESHPLLHLTRRLADKQHFLKSNHAEQSDQSNPLESDYESSH